MRLNPVGADVQPGGAGTHFRVWAPGKAGVDVVFETGEPARRLEPEGDDYFSALLADVRAGARYKYQLGDEAYPDPGSRYQPDGVHGFSQVVDPGTFPWSDETWKGVELLGQIIYELHLGTFTPEGTWNAAAGKLQHLKDTGVTVLEIMPVAEFPGKFGWGYDGVQLYAPAGLYGTPDDFRRFVDLAHAAGIAVILDVVYNHLGPDGNYLPKFSPYYLTDKHKTDWGQAINFDGDHNGPVREYFRANGAYWVREYHLDGLRLDATQDIHDASEPHIIAEISEVARQAADGRSILLIGENEPQKTNLIRPIGEGGYGLDALWNDDFHHSATVALTGKADAYYTDYRGRPQELLSALKYGYLYQGQWYRWQNKRRGTSNLGLPLAAMVTFIQNHDQIANSARGQRTRQLSAPGAFKAITAVMILGPGTPMLFQGQEFGASSPFLFFADHKPELARLIRLGRVEFLEQWRALRLPEIRKCFADPCSEESFLRCKLNWKEVEEHSEIYALHRDLLELRRKDPILSQQGEYGLDGAVLSESCFVLRYFSPGFKNDRLLVVNLGSDLELNPAPEPLLAPPDKKEWMRLWSSDGPQYGGCGTAPLDSAENWRIPGQAAVVLQPVTASENKN